MKTTINALDPSQKFILEKLTDGKADDLSLVYGPPGTGKSHLIVSLLFELANSKKKVLFVSQNREAIEVVIRKYKDLDREMGLNDTDITFLDFCLHLSDRSQRTIKYISSLRSRLFSKTIRRVTSVDEIDNNIPYALYYRELDREKNFEGVSSSADSIGLDMLLSNQIEFVKSENIIKKILHRTEDIDADFVFSLLREHKSKAEHFKYFNNPSGELRFLNRVNDSAITIGKLHDIVSEISEACRKNGELTEMSYAKENDIRTILHFIAVLKEVSKEYNLEAIKNDNVRFEDIFSTVKTIQSNKKAFKLPAVDLSAVDLPNDAISGGSDLKFIKDCSDIESLKRYKDELNLVAGHLVTCGCEKEKAKLNQVVSGIMHCLTPDFPVIDSMLNLGQLSGSEVEEIVKAAIEWTKRSGISRLLDSKPTQLVRFNKQEIIALSEYSDSLRTIAKILNSTNVTFVAFKNTIKRYWGSYVEFEGNKKVLIKIVSDLLNVLSGEFGVFFSGNDCCELLMLAKELTAKIDKIISVYSRNRAINEKSIKEGIEAINENIENRSLKKENDALFGKIEKYVANAKNGWQKLPAISDKPKVIDAIVQDMNSIQCIASVDAEALNEARSIIDSAAKENIFSKDFFRAAKDEKIGLWVDRIESLLTFEDRNIFGDFIIHNDFLMKLSKALGSINKSYLESYLEMELDYESFSEHIAYDLIKALFGNIPTNKCRSIKSVQYFNDFSKNLEKARKKIYVDAMEALQLSCEDPAKHLAVQSEWRSARSVMEKIRANTQKIIDAYPVIMATPAEVAKYLAPNKEIFDYVIFDEASQLLPGQALPSLYRAKKAIIVGDPHQMPPTSSVLIGATSKTDFDDEFELDDTSDSILDRIKAMQIDSAYHLKVHYRSKYNILFEPSREAIYSQDDIRPIVEAKSVKMPLYIRDGLGDEQNIGFEAVIERINYYIRENEDDSFCVLFTKKTGEGSETQFKKYLETKGSAVDAILKRYGDERLLISTVTNCQGISGDHTIMFIPSYRSPKAMWFFRANVGAYKRLNVAITRQIESLDIVMGDDKEKWIRCCQEMISDPSTAPDVLISAQLMEGLLLNAGRQVDEDYLERILGRNADEIDSPLTEELYKKLNQYFAIKRPGDVRIWCEVGYKIRIPDDKALNRNSYSVGYRIDIGIYSTRHKKFVLGIEMDGATYHSGFEKEFSDAQRQDILEQKGWKIYRIWSTNWLNDPEGEFNALVKVIEEELDKEPEPEAAIVKIETEPETTKDDDTASLDEEDEDRGSPEEKDELIEETIPRSADAMVDYWQRLSDYLNKCFKFGRPINIKMVPKIDDSDLLERTLNMPYQRMIIKRITEDSIEARFDEELSSPYKIYKKYIVAYKDE